MFNVSIINTMSGKTISYIERFDRIDSSLDRLTTTLLEGFDNIDKELEKKASKEDVNRLFNLMDK